VAQVTATQSIDVNVTPAQAAAALADYATVRPAILPEQYRDYRVLEGGQGAGTVVEWTLQATEKRVRNVKATVSVGADGTVTETDANSSMVTVYQVAPAGTGARVTTTTSWQGAGGIGGFFEKTFAPKGLGRIQLALLTNLKTRLEA